MIPSYHIVVRLAEARQQALLAEAAHGRRCAETRRARTLRPVGAIRLPDPARVRTGVAGLRRALAALVS